MTRDQALLIARRIMDRCEMDRAMHLDAIADEVIAGNANLRCFIPYEVAEPAKLDRRKSAVRMDQ